MLKKFLVIFIFSLLGLFLYLYLANFDTDEVIVAVIDTGVAESQLKTDQVLPGFDFVDYDYTPIDNNGHGTLMTKIISEIADDAYILPVRFLADSKSYSINRPFAIFYSILKGADIVNMSFNGEGDILTKLVIAYGNSKGVLFIGSSGNKGLDSVDYPAKYKDVLAVGGFNQKSKTYYGNYGNEVSFIAPAIYESKIDNKCEVGTSISAAYMSGVVAYVKCNFPEKTKDEIKKFLCDNSKKLNLLGQYQYLFIDSMKIKAIKENSSYFWYKEPDIIQSEKKISIPIDYYNVYKIQLYEDGNLIKNIPLTLNEISLYNKEGTHIYTFVVMGNDITIEKKFLIISNHKDNNHLAKY